MSADPIAGIPYPLRSVAPNVTATMQPPIDAIGAKFGAGTTRLREIPVTIYGALGSALDIATPQTIAASPLGAGSYVLRASASMQGTCPAGTGLQMDIMLDGVVIATNKGTNAAASGNTITAAANRSVKISDTASHIVRAVVTPLSGTVTLIADTTRFFEISATACWPTAL